MGTALNLSKKDKMRRRLCTIAMLAAVAAASISAQNDWPTPGRDPGNQRYSPLTQINTSNVSKLTPAWTFQLRKEGALFRASESIPLLADGILYISWPRFHLAALEPETGKMLWEFTAPGSYSGNGLADMRSMAYWPGHDTSPPEILFGTEEGELYALNAKT